MEAPWCRASPRSPPREPCWHCDPASSRWHPPWDGTWAPLPGGGSLFQGRCTGSGGWGHSRGAGRPRRAGDVAAASAIFAALWKPKRSSMGHLGPLGLRSRFAIRWHRLVMGIIGVRAVSKAFNSRPHVLALITNPPFERPLPDRGISLESTTSASSSVHFAPPGVSSRPWSLVSHRGPFSSWSHGHDGRHKQSRLRHKARPLAPPQLGRDQNRPSRKTGVR